MAFIAGYGGTCSFAAVDLKVKEWHLTGTNDLLDTTNTSTSGLKTWIKGLTGYQVEIKAGYDSSATPDPELLPGASGALVLTHGTSAKTASGTMLVRSYKIDNVIGDLVTYSISGEISGDVTFA